MNESRELKVKPVEIYDCDDLDGDLSGLGDLRTANYRCLRPRSGYGIRTDIQYSFKPAPDPLPQDHWLSTDTGTTSNTSVNEPSLQIGAVNKTIASTHEKRNKIINNLLASFKNEQYNTPNSEARKSEETCTYNYGMNNEERNDTSGNSYVNTANERGETIPKLQLLSFESFESEKYDAQKKDINCFDDTNQDIRDPIQVKETRNFNVTHLQNNPIVLEYERRNKIQRNPVFLGSQNRHQRKDTPRYKSAGGHSLADLNYQTTFKNSTAAKYDKEGWRRRHAGNQHERVKVSYNPVDYNFDSDSLDFLDTDLDKKVQPTTEKETELTRFHKTLDDVRRSLWEKNEDKFAQTQNFSSTKHIPSTVNSRFPNANIDKSGELRRPCETVTAKKGVGYSSNKTNNVTESKSKDDNDFRIHIRSKTRKRFL